MPSSMFSGVYRYIVSVEVSLIHMQCILVKSSNSPSVSISKNSIIYTPVTCTFLLHPSSLCRPSSRFFLKCLAPLTARCVHGGNAIIMSHLSLSNSGITSCCKCHSGCPPLHGRISHEYASCPSFLNSVVTLCDSSHATNIFICNISSSLLFVAL